MYHRWIKKTSYGRFLPGAILSINSQVTMIKKSQYASAGRVKTIKKISSENHLVNFVVIILGRFPINKTQNWRFYITSSDLVKILTFSTLIPPKTLISGPKKISHSWFPDRILWRIRKKLIFCPRGLWLMPKSVS